MIESERERERERERDRETERERERKREKERERERESRIYIATWKIIFRSLACAAARSSHDNHSSCWSESSKLSLWSSVQFFLPYIK